MKTKLITAIIFIVFSMQILQGDWTYRRTIEIFPADTVLTDYQLQLTLTPGNFDYAHSVGDSGQDLRFSTDGTGNTEPNVHYWIEDWNENDTSKVWIKVPSISDANTTAVYMYYGNNVASSRSNGDSTFIFFDDFDDGTYTDKWMPSKVSGYIGATFSEAGGVLTFTNCCQGGSNCSEGPAILFSEDSFLIDNEAFAIDAILSQATNTAGHSSFSVHLTEVSMAGDPQGAYDRRYGFGSAAYIGDTDDVNRMYPIEAYFENFNPITPTLGALYRYILTYDGSTKSNMKIFDNTGTLLSDADHFYSYSDSAYLNVYFNVHSPGSTIDEIKIYKSSVNEPTVLINSAEETGNWLLTPTTIAHWTFDEMSGDTLHDISGNGHYGVVSNAAWTNGYQGSGALSFNGISSEVTVPSDPGFSDLPELTVEAIINVDSLPTLDSYGRIVAVWGPFNGFNSSTEQAFTLGLIKVNNGTYLSFGVRTGSNTFYDGTGVSFLYNDFPINRWMHVAGVFDNGHIYLYANDTLLAENPVYTNAIINHADIPLTVGYSLGTNNNNDNLNTHFNGRVDAIRISNIALTPDQFLEFTPPDTSLIAYYPFNGNANDESGNGNDGTEYGGVTSVSDRFGNANSAYSFDGVDDYIDVSNYEGFNFGTGSFSIVAWALNTSNSSGRIVAKSNHDTDDGYQLGISTVAYFYLLDSEPVVNSTDSLNDGIWHQIVGIRNGDTLKMYIDGMFDNLVTGVLNWDVSTTHTVKIGRRDGSQPTYFDGIIDDIYIYNRSLSNQEIDSLYHLGGWAQVDINLSMAELSANVDDTVLVPLNVQFLGSSSYSSTELTLGGYQGGLSFTGLDTAGTLIGSVGWSYAVNEIGDSLVITAMAGAQPITGSGVLCNLQFVVTGSACETFPVNILSAVFDTGQDAVVSTNGSVTVDPIPSFGDVDENGQVQAYDAALILKHLVGMDTLSCQGLANAEVSMNDTLTALDASLILQYQVDSIDTLPYSGTLLLAGGDFSGFGEVVTGPSQSIVIPLNINGGTDIYSIEGFILFDDNQMTYEDISLVGLSNNAIQTRTTEGQLFFAFASAEPLNVEGELGSIVFTTSADFQGAELTIESLRINENLHFENIVTDVTLGVDMEDILPTTFALHQNYPNPFNPSTTLQIDLPQNSPVQVIILDMLGRRVTTLTDRNLPAGVHRLVWNGKDSAGNSVPTGIYFARMETPEHTRTIKMVMMK